MISLKKKTWTLTCIQTFTDQSLQTWYDDRDLYALHLDISLDDPDLHSRSQWSKKSKTLVSIFLLIYVSIWMKFSVLPQPVWFVEAHANIYFAQVLFKGENSAEVILWNIVISMVMCQDTCEPICFKLGLMLSTAKL